MRIRIKHGCWWVRDGWGGVFFFWMCFGDPKDKVPEWLYRHELEHVYQMHQLKGGRIRWYIDYLWQLFRNGYKRNKWERKAYEVANSKKHKALLKHERAWWDRNRIDL